MFLVSITKMYFFAVAIGLQLLHTTLRAGNLLSFEVVGQVCTLCLHHLDLLPLLPEIK